MKKVICRIASFTLVFIMTLTMGAPAFAANMELHDHLDDAVSSLLIDETLSDEDV